MPPAALLLREVRAELTGTLELLEAGLVTAALVTAALVAAALSWALWLPSAAGPRAALSLGDASRALSTRVIQLPSVVGSAVSATDAAVFAATLEGGRFGDVLFEELSCSRNSNRVLIV